MFRLTLIALLCALAARSYAREPEAQYRASLWELRVGALGAIQSSSNFAITGTAAWAPKIRLFDENYLRLSMGAFPLKNNNSSNQTFWVLDGRAFIGVQADEGFLEVGGGMQNWGNSNGGWAAVASGNILWPFGRMKVGPLDHIYLGYSAYFGAPTMTHEVTVGLGVAF